MIQRVDIETGTYFAYEKLKQEGGKTSVFKEADFIRKAVEAAKSIVVACEEPELLIVTHDVGLFLAYAVEDNIALYPADYNYILNELSIPKKEAAFIEPFSGEEGYRAPLIRLQKRGFNIAYSYHIKPIVTNLCRNQLRSYPLHSV